MNWLNIQTSQLRAAEFIGSEPVARAAWLCVLAYCCDQENSGVIKTARGWKDRQWQQTCGVTLDEIESAGLLLRWQGDDLSVWGYPVEKQAEVHAKREAGSRGGKQRASNASSTPSSCASTEGKGKEGEGNGKEGELAPARGGTDSELPTEDQAITIGSMSGVPPDFCKIVYSAWHSREGKDGAGVRVGFARHVKKRWERERGEWEAGTHRDSPKGNRIVRAKV